MGFYVKSKNDSLDLAYVPTQEDIKYLAIIVAEKILRSGIHFDYVLSVANGGDSVSRLIASYCGLGNERQGSIRARSYNPVEDSLSQNQDELIEIYRDMVGIEDKTVLIIDDLSDTGDTLIWTKKEVEKLNVEQHGTATLWVKEGTKSVPDFYGEKRVKEWIVLLRESDEPFADLEARKVKDEPFEDVLKRKETAYNAMQYLISKGINEKIFPDKLRRLNS